MIQVRKSAERGHAQHGWLDSHHTFSFADYYDPRQMGFSNLRVMNEDRVQAGAGFPPHSHRDMEIISYVLDGAIAHEDSMGNGSVIRPGDVQMMRAGTGVTHSEYNASKDEPAHFLQVWIEPKYTGMKPAYQQKHFSAEEKKNHFRLVASPDGRDGSLTLNQDASLYALLLDPGQTARQSLAPGRRAWVQVARGEVEVNGQRLEEGDGARITDEQEISVTARQPAEILLFDLA